MKEIIELNERIQHEAPQAVPKEFGFLLVTSEPGGEEELGALPPSIRRDLDELCEKLKRAMPDDFGFQISFEAHDPYLMVVYRDGAQTEGNCPLEWDPKRSIFEQLDAVNWNEQRAGVLARCQSFDVMKERAKDVKPRLPCTKEIQKAFRDEMREFVKTKRKDALRVHAMLFREDEGVKEETFEDMNSFCRELPNIMTVQDLVVTVVADGKPLPVERIESLKKQALKELEDMPISHAKALWKL